MSTADVHEEAAEITTARLMTGRARQVQFTTGESFAIDLPSINMLCQTLESIPEAMCHHLRLLLEEASEGVPICDASLAPSIAGIVRHIFGAEVHAALDHEVSIAMAIVASKFAKEQNKTVDTEATRELNTEMDVQRVLFEMREEGEEEVDTDEEIELVIVTEDDDESSE